MASFIAALTLAASFAPAALAQDAGDPNFTPLASKRFEYTALPFKADPTTGERGPQSGFNICNSTTENQQSMCQTAIVNSIDDFCLWGPSEPNQEIGVIEGEAVAWCTKAGHGTRIIPKGALTGVQFIRTPDYVQVTGIINQELIDIAKDDQGGEMDPHGADQRGNPIGGLVFSNTFTGSYVQTSEWTNFMGGGAFCIKACDPAGPNAGRYCEHIYDRVGCNYNAPAAYQDGVFLSCKGDNMDFVGVYTGADGQVSTWFQPDESLGPISTVPYQPRIPASSECTTFTSAQLYADGPAATVSVSHSSSSRGLLPGTNSHSGTGTQTRTSTSSTSTSSNNNSAAPRGVSTGAAGSLAAVLGASLLAAFML